MPVHYYLDLKGVRLFQVIWVIVNIVTFIAILLELGSKRIAAVFAIVTLGLFQARSFYDPITSFGCLLQFLVLFGSLSLYFLVLNERRNQLHWSMLSLLAYTCSLLIYEEGIVFGLCIGAFVFCRSKTFRDALKILIPYFIVTMIWVGILVYLRQTQLLVYSGNRIAITYKTWVSFFYQFSGAFPLSYPLFVRSGLFQWKHILEFFQKPSQYWILGICCFAAGLLLSYSNKKQLQNPINRSFSAIAEKNQRKLYYLISFILIFISSLLIAISQKYQNLLGRPGHSYLPVYIAYFGVVLALATFCSQKVDFSKKADAFSDHRI